MHNEYFPVEMIYSGYLSESWKTKWVWHYIAAMKNHDIRYQFLTTRKSKCQILLLSLSFRLAGCFRFCWFIVIFDGSSVYVCIVKFILKTNLNFRDHDWFFATERGRASLRKQCCKDRLAVVKLYRDQKYDNMEQVKDELGPYVLQLTPESMNVRVLLSLHRISNY